MLQNVTIEHFRGLLGSVVPLQLADGSQLQVEVTALVEKPAGRAGDDSRMPFNVSLSTRHPSSFIDGPCALELPALGVLPAVFVSRVPPMGRDERLAYYCIAFN